MLTRVRLIVHLVFGLIAGLMYFNIGNDASQGMIISFHFYYFRVTQKKTILFFKSVYNNGGSLIFGQLFLMGTAKMPQVITCN